jgi:hypothetical protein
MENAPGSSDTNGRLPPTAARAVAAYGGAVRWMQADHIEASVAVTGLAWWLKGRRPVPGTQLYIKLDSPMARLSPVDSSGLTGVMTGKDAHLEDASGRVVARREDAGRYFPGGRRVFYWDSLDLAYFGGYAMWNYFAFPRLLLRTDIEWQDVAPNVLEAHFPKTLPTPSAIQRFHFDPGTGLLARHDCTLEAVGPWARVTQVVDHYGERDGLPFFGLRTVYFRRADGTRFPWPKLIVGRVLDWKLCQGKDSHEHRRPTGSEAISRTG